MDNLERFISFNLPRCFYSLELARNGVTYLSFERETLKSQDGLQSVILVGRIIYRDQLENVHRSPPLLVKIFPDRFQRNSYTEMTFMNEMFVYKELIPFFSSLNTSFSNSFPKFYFGNLIFSAEEDGCVILENLQHDGYYAPESKIFLNIDHLILMMKKLGEFHAHSYLAKNTQSSKFHSLLDNLVETNFAAVKILPTFLQSFHEFYLNLLLQDEKYSNKVEKLTKMISDADEFVASVFSTRNEPVAVLCHGDFLRNNVLFKYDLKNYPIDMKFIDVANMKYCTPAIDLALVLYMNADQFTRDKYWDHLLNVYYESLKNTFPYNEVPSKNLIISEFKRNALQTYLFVAFFLPAALELERTGKRDWVTSALSSEYEEYRNKPLTLIPTDVLVQVNKKIHVGKSREYVLDVLKDMLDRNFV